MHVIWSGHQNAFDVFLFFEHFAIVGVALRFWQVYVFQSLHSGEALFGLSAIEMNRRPSWLRLRIRRVNSFAQIGNIGVQARKTYVRIAPIDVA